MASLTIGLTAPNGHKFTQPLGLFINNEWVPAQSGEKITTVSPADESTIAEVHAAGPQDIDLAVRAARQAFDNGWAEASGTRRADLLMNLASLIDAHAETLAAVEAWDGGKPYEVALAEDVSEAARVFRYYAGWADRLHGRVIPTESSQLVYTIREPYGVCGQIVAWNYPLILTAWKLAPALAAGNTAVIKASEVTPLSILHIANLVKEAGFPPGVVNVVNGYGQAAGAAIAAHEGINKVSFTGSTATGKEIMRLAAGTMKSVTLETGGKSPMLVFADADLTAATAWGHIAIMSNAGQACSATSRILVQEGVFEEYVRLFKQQTQSVSKVGDPFAQGTFQGPLVNRTQYDRVLALIESGKAEGAQCVLGGGPFKNANVNHRGFYIEPTVFTNVREDMRIYREEIFGPVVVIVPFTTEEDGVRKANDTNYGLGGAVFTRDPSRGHRLARKIQAGSIWINSSNNGDVRVPFSGFKQSGIGQENGEEGISNYLAVKSVYLQVE